MRQEAMTEAWVKWESQLINGVFPLRRFLSASDHGAVFLTEYKAQHLPNAALKLVPAIPTLMGAQLSYWTTAANLSHPHLIRLLEAGRCQLGSLQCLFVVMEYAEQTLSQILPQRALTPDEVQEMLLPILDALAFLHRQDLVQGRLKPSNILVVNDQLKLASDTIRPAGESTASIAQSSVYDPPEAGDGSFSAAGDIWSLGITLIESLTQYPPARPYNAPLPTTLPPAFVDIVRQCLDRNPANRPTVADLQAHITAPVVSEPQPAPQPPMSVSQPVLSIPEPLMYEVPSRATPPQESPRQRLLVPAIAGVVILSVAVWAGLRMLSSRTSSQQSASPAVALQAPEKSASAPSGISTPSSGASTAKSKPAPSRPASRSSARPAHPSAGGSPSVLHGEIPFVPRSALDTIHGTVRVGVRVTVDSSGHVVQETLENPGPSKYFARLATGAARKWTFAPAANGGSREWLLRFEFTRGGTTAQAVVRRER
jgi:TonB family protein